MKKKVIIISGVSLLIGGAVAYCFWQKNKKKAETNVLSLEKEKEKEKANTATSSINDIETDDDFMGKPQTTSQILNQNIGIKPLTKPPIPTPYKPGNTNIHKTPISPYFKDENATQFKPERNV
jgi:hypothetical protein